MYEGSTQDGVRRYHGVYRGVVKNSTDPSKLRRVKVVVPQITGTEVTDWIWPILSTNKPPAVGAGVWVLYVGGDPEYPVWIGEFGKNTQPNKQVYVKPLENTVSLTGLSTVVINTQSDGTKELDLVDTIISMAQKLKNHETRITALESNLTSLHSTLATRSSINHTHNSNG